MRRKKICLTSILLVAIFISLVAFGHTAEAATIKYSGKSGDLNWSIDSNGVLRISGTGDYAYDNAGNFSPKWHDYSKYVTSAVVNVKGITRTDYMFSNFVNLKSLNLSGFDTSKVTDMSDMFAGCSSLSNVDLSRFDTSKVTKMNGMFYECNSLKSVDLSGFDTSKVTDMSYMFAGCSSLTSVDFSEFDTSKVTNMNGMFYGCSSLTSVDLSEFDTSKVAHMAEMFYGCSSLTSVDLSGFDTSKVTNMIDMFYGCSSLTSVDLSGFDTSNIIQMYDMFTGCKNLSTCINLTIGSNTGYDDCFDGAATAEQAAIYVKYSGACTEERAKAVIATKSDSSHVYLAEKNSLAYCSIVLGTKSYTYNGTAKKPSVTVKNGTTTLTKGTDYTVSYKNNTNAGAATVTITGKGSYTGTAIKTFTIKKAGAGLSFSSSSISKKATDSSFTNTLTKKTNESVTYTSSNTSVATINSSGKVTIVGGGTTVIKAKSTGLGNYKAGSAKYTLVVNKLNNNITANNYTKTCSSSAQSFTLNAKAVHSAKLSYKSSSTKVKVSSTGKVTIAANYIGKAKITITAASTAKYKSCKKTIYVTVNPPKTSLVKVTSPSKGQLYFKWNTNSKVTGYNIYYSTSSTFATNKKQTRSVTAVGKTKNNWKINNWKITGVKRGKRYYVKIRTYYKNGTGTYYSGWSSSKSVVIK